MKGQRKPPTGARQYARTSIAATCPKVVTVHDNRFVAPGLLEALAGRAEVVADSAYGAAALAAGRPDHAQM